jgi:Zn-dependent protease/predicted transcriptional regulator
MNNAFQIGKVMGIPVRLHLTFLLIIPWVAYIFAGVSTTMLGKVYGFGMVQPELSRWMYSFAFAVLLFLCVALHELGHSYVALRYGIAIRSITLYLFGGVASMENIPRDPRMELWLAFAGPAVSGGLSLLLGLAYIPASFLGAYHPLPILLWTLSMMNLILMGFNLIPAFPMDGGRLLRAWFATRMPYVTATKRAASIGKVFAMMMAGIGLFTRSILTLVVALFVYIGASEEERATEINVSLEGIRVRRIMSSNIKTIGPNSTLRELMDLMFNEKHRGYPVVEGDKLQGIVTLTDLQRIPDHLRESTIVSEIMSRKIYVIGPDEEAASAMKIMSERKIRRLPVLEDGKLIGIISREDLVRAIELCADTKA